MQDERRNRALSALLLAGVSPFLFIACAGGTAMKAHYSSAVVQPVLAEPGAEGELVISYTMPPESMYYSPGVNYEQSGDMLRVTINRCGIHEQCETMAKVPLPLKNGWGVEVRVPYRGGKVVMVYSDREEQIYPQAQEP